MVFDTFTRELTESDRNTSKNLNRIGKTLIGLFNSYRNGSLNVEEEYNKGTVF